DQHDRQSRKSRNASFGRLVGYPDGRRAAAEVMSTPDSRALVLLASTLKNGSIRRPELTRTCVVFVEPHPRLKDVSAAAPAILQRLDGAASARAAHPGSGGARRRLLRVQRTNGAAPARFPYRPKGYGRLGRRRR